jgi:hypothetical protein
VENSKLLKLEIRVGHKAAAFFFTPLSWSKSLLHTTGNAFFPLARSL